MTKFKNAIEFLREILPQVAITVELERDDSYTWDGDDTDPEEWDEPLVPYTVIVKATAIVNGQRVEGEDTLGGTYYKSGAKPEDAIADEIGGYLTQMVEDAISDLESNLDEVNGRAADELNNELYHAQLDIEEYRRNRDYHERYATDKKGLTTHEGYEAVRAKHPNAVAEDHGGHVRILTEPGGDIIASCCLRSDAWAEAGEILLYGKPTRQRL